MSQMTFASTRYRKIIGRLLTSITILLVFPIAAVAGRFASVVPYDAGAPCINAIAVADVNGDGKPDVLMAGGCTDINGQALPGSVSVFLGNGDGSFQPAKIYDSGGFVTTSLQVSDVNGDGKPDVVATSVCSTAACPIPIVAVLLGNGDGTFQPPVTYDSGLQGYSIADADLNGDGRVDLVVAGSYLPGRPLNLIGVLLGNGDGTFHPVVTYGSGVSGFVVLSDVNDDGKRDALVTNLANNSFGVLLGNGDGTFQPTLTYGLSSQPVGLSIADVNGDGKADALIAEQFGSSDSQSAVGVMLGNGDGTFGPVMSYDSGAAYAMFLAIGDVNLDGKPDAVVAHCARVGNACPSSNGLVSVLQGNGDGTFQPRVLYKSGGVWARAVVIADVNGDGLPDLVVANNSGGTNGDGTLGVLLSTLVVKTSMVLNGSPNPAQVNDSITLAATITSNPPVADGELVTFSNGTTKLGTGLTKNGTATLTTSFSQAKTYRIKASFAGDRSHKASLAWLNEVVKP